MAREPEQIAVIAALIVERPLCVSRLAEKTGEPIRAVRLITSRIADAILEGRGALTKDESEEASSDATLEAELAATPAEA